MAGKARRPRSESVARGPAASQSPGIRLPLTAHIVESPMKGAVQRSTQDGDGPLRSALGRGCPMAIVILVQSYVLLWLTGTPTPALPPQQ